MTEPPQDRTDASQDRAGPSQDRAAMLGVTDGGPDTAEFVEQFRRLHQGQPVQLLVYLHPALSHEHLADTVRDIVAMPGVGVVRWINRLPVGPEWLTDRVRAALARFRVRAVATTAAELPDGVRGRVAQPIVVLLGPTVGVVESGDAGLLDLVDGALRRAADEP